MTPSNGYGCRRHSSACGNKGISLGFYVTASWGLEVEDTLACLIMHIISSRLIGSQSGKLCCGSEIDGSQSDWVKLHAVELYVLVKNSFISC